QVTGNGHRDAIPGFQSFGDLEASAVLVFRLAGRTYLALRDAIPVHQENFIDSVAVVDSALGQKDCLFFFAAGNGSLQEKSGLEAAIQIKQQGFGLEGARVLGDGWIDARDFAVKGFSGKCLTWRSTVAPSRTQPAQ